MPQMSPMNWLILFIYFNLALYLASVKLFYMSNMKMNSSLVEMKSASNVFMLFI